MAGAAVVLGAHYIVQVVGEPECRNLNKCDDNELTKWGVVVY